MHLEGKVALLTGGALGIGERKIPSLALPKMPPLKLGAELMGQTLTACFWGANTPSGQWVVLARYIHISPRSGPVGIPAAAA